jgi:glycosyltransferase involved in cell wall biosynthesis
VCERTANLDEFPAASVYAIRDDWSWIQRAWAFAIRGLPSQRQNVVSLDRTVVRSIIRHLKPQSVDLFYTHFVWHANELLDVLEGLRSPAPLVSWVGGSDVTMAHRFGQRYLSRIRDCFARASLILCASEFLRKKTLDLGAPPEKLLVHYVGVPIPKLRRRTPNSSPASFKILAVSRLIEVKGVPYTIRAFARALPRMPGATLEVLGEGRLRAECGSLAAELGVADRIAFRGQVPAAEVERAMDRADLFVQHSVRASNDAEDGLPYSIIEAAARGLAVVATRSGGIPEAVVDNETGILVEPTDENRMADAMVELSQNPSKRAALGSAGRRRAEQCFSLDRQNPRLRALLLSLCYDSRLDPRRCA